MQAVDAGSIPTRASRRIRSENLNCFVYVNGIRGGIAGASLV
jgi:hypothetical protein